MWHRFHSSVQIDRQLRALYFMSAQMSPYTVRRHLTSANSLEQKKEKEKKAKLSNPLT